MSWQPMLAADPAVRLHAVAALLALALGAWVLWRPKGTRRHRTAGRVWTALMVVAALSSLWINEVRLWGPFSPLHGFVASTLVCLMAGITAARRGQMASHLWWMQAAYAGLVIAGLFALLPNRRLSQALVGEMDASWLTAHGWLLPLAAGLPLLALMLRRTMRSRNT